MISLIGSIEGNARNRIGADAEIVWADNGQSVAYTVQPEIPWNERFIDRATVAPATLDGPIVVDGASDDAPLLRAQGMRGAFFAETPKELRIGSRVIASGAACVRSNPARRQPQNARRRPRPGLQMRLSRLRQLRDHARQKLQLVDPLDIIRTLMLTPKMGKPFGRDVS